MLNVWQSLILLWTFCKSPYSENLWSLIQGYPGMPGQHGNRGLPGQPVSKQMTHKWLFLRTSSHERCASGYPGASQWSLRVNFASVYGLTHVLLTWDFHCPVSNFRRRVTRSSALSNPPCGGNFLHMKRGQKLHHGKRSCMHTSLHFVWNKFYSIKLQKQ